MPRTGSVSTGADPHPRHYWEEMRKDLRPVYTAPTKAAAAERFLEFDAKLGQ